MEPNEVTPTEGTPQRLDVSNAIDPRVPCAECSVHRPCRHTHDHVGLDTSLGQRPQHTDLVATESATSWQHEGEWSWQCA